MEKYFDSIWRNNFLRFKSPLLLVSGGVDSVVLLRLLQQAWKNKFINRLHVLHVCHGLRKEQNIEEINLIKNMCSGNFFLPTPLTVLKQRCITKNVQQAARKFRYSGAMHIAMQIKADCIVAAHHADDAVETSAMAFLQGKSSFTLASLQLQSTIKKGAYSYCVLRPLLGIKKEKIKEYASKAELFYIEDFSNSKSEYRRNFLRYEVFPILTQKFSHYDVGILQSKKLLTENNQLLRTLLQGVLLRSGNLIFVNKKYFSLPISLQRAALYIATLPWLKGLRISSGAYKAFCRALQNSYSSQQNQKNYSTRTLLTLIKGPVQYECRYAANIIQFCKKKFSQQEKHMQNEERTFLFFATFKSFGRMLTKLVGVPIAINWQVPVGEIFLRVETLKNIISAAEKEHTRMLKMLKNFKYPNMLFSEFLVVQAAKTSSSWIDKKNLQWETLAIFHPNLLHGSKKKWNNCDFHIPNPVFLIEQHIFNNAVVLPEINVKIG